MNFHSSLLQRNVGFNGMRAWRSTLKVSELMEEHVNTDRQVILSTSYTVCFANAGILNNVLITCF